MSTFTSIFYTWKNKKKKYSNASLKWQCSKINVIKGALELYSLLLHSCKVNIIHLLFFENMIMKIVFYSNFSRKI